MEPRHTFQLFHPQPVLPHLWPTDNSTAHWEAKGTLQWKMGPERAVKVLSCGWQPCQSAVETHKRAERSQLSCALSWAVRNFPCETPTQWHLLQTGTLGKNQQASCETCCSESTLPAGRQVKHIFSLNLYIWGILLSHFIEPLSSESSPPPRNKAISMWVFKILPHLGVWDTGLARMLYHVYDKILHASTLTLFATPASTFYYSCMHL